MARKSSKADIIIKLLTEGFTAAQIKKRVKVSESYIYATMKKLTAGVEPKAGEFIVVEGAKSAQEIDAILNERATTYGSFKDVAEVAQEIKALIHTHLNATDKVLDPDQMEALDMIASKLGRIINGNADYVDSWIDIAGYAQLVADRLEGKVR